MFCYFIVFLLIYLQVFYFVFYFVFFVYFVSYFVFKLLFFLQNINDVLNATGDAYGVDVARSTPVGKLKRKVKYITIENTNVSCVTNNLRLLLCCLYFLSLSRGKICDTKLKLFVELF